LALPKAVARFNRVATNRAFVLELPLRLLGVHEFLLLEAA
jgi:hypothetical protein